MTSLQFTKTR